MHLSASTHYSLFFALLYSGNTVRHRGGCLDISVIFLKKGCGLRAVGAAYLMPGRLQPTAASCNAGKFFLRFFAISRSRPVFFASTTCCVLACCEHLLNGLNLGRSSCRNVWGAALGSDFPNKVRKKLIFFLPLGRC